MRVDEFRKLQAAQPRKRAQPERVVAITLAEHLALRAGPHIWWCHYPAGEKRSAVTGAILREMGVKSGTPDYLFAVRQGDAAQMYARMYALEIKADHHGRLSDVQQVQHQQMRRAGVVVGVAAGIDEALAILGPDGWGILP